MGGGVEDDFTGKTGAVGFSLTFYDVVLRRIVSEISFQYRPTIKMQEIPTHLSKIFMTATNWGLFSHKGGKELGMQRLKEVSALYNLY